MNSSSSSIVNLQQIILVGSGDTCCTPNTTCLIKNVSIHHQRNNEDDDDQDDEDYSPIPRPNCKNCINALQDINCRNNRSQTSILLTFSNKKSILVDCGVTFRDSALKAFRTAAFDFPQICGYIATRNSPDSILGVDDIREVTTRGEKIALYAPSAVLDSLHKMFPYIMPSSKPLSLNQALLWTAGLTPVENGPMKHGMKFCFQTTPPPRSHHKKKGKKMEQDKDEGNSQEVDGVQQQENQQQHDEVEIVCVGNSEKESRENCGFVISLESDGKLNYPNYDEGRKSKVALYLPFDCISPSEQNGDGSDDQQQQKHYSTPAPEILKHFEVEVAMIAFPKMVLQGDDENNFCESEIADKILNIFREDNTAAGVAAGWKEVKIKRIVVICLPHNVVANEDDEVTNNEKSEMKATCSFGYDSQMVWKRE